MRHVRVRRIIIETCRSMERLGLNQGTSGNVSARAGDSVLITPSGISYEALRPGDIVELARNGVRLSGERAPSSEWRFHVDILNARPEAGAVVHAHAPFCTALACTGREIPAFHYMVARAGGDSIRCARYATFGTQALSDNAIGALSGRFACLLANHGMIAIGADLERALSLALEVETLAAQFCRALQVGEPRLLPDDEMQRVLERFETYGQGA